MDATELVRVYGKGKFAEMRMNHRNNKAKKKIKGSSFVAETGMNHRKNKAKKIKGSSFVAYGKKIGENEKKRGRCFERREKEMEKWLDKGKDDLSLMQKEMISDNVKRNIVNAHDGNDAA